MILDKKTFNLKDFSAGSFITHKQLSQLLDDENEFKAKLIELFNIDSSTTNVLQIGNAKKLLEDITSLDSQCTKIDIESKVKDVQLSKLLEEEKAIFEIFGIKNNFILSKNKSDLLLAETRYAAKADILDYYNLSKFANYCRDHKFEDLMDDIKVYLKNKNASNEDIKKLRLIYINSKKEFYLRAITSSSAQGYKDFGINFSIFVAIASLSQYVDKTKTEVFINNYSIDDSNLYLSFAIKESIEVNSKLSLSFNLILENDEVKRNAVSFNGVFNLKFQDEGKSSEIFLKPKGLKRQDLMYPTDLLSFQHKGSVESVFEKVKDLPTLIESFISQVKDDAKKISAIENPNDVKDFIANKVKNSKKPEFQVYKEPIQKKLASMNVDNVFMLFELLRSVEELFEHDDIISKDFWRTKLYESLIERK